MKILSIETSCDETALAILDISGNLEKPDIKLVANVLMSQMHLHEQYGGVYPTLAKREHEKNLPILLKQLLNDASMSEENPEIDVVAVTEGPGLEPALWTGITFAQEWSKKWNKPLVPVNHMEGHIFSVLYGSEEKLTLPALALLVSGGHTELVYIKDFGHYLILGRTVDDAVGEAFDKVARMLGLGYPGGPKISVLAEKHRSEGKTDEIKFPRPMIHSKDLNFSYSGLKTAVLYKLKELDMELGGVKEAVARGFEDAAVEVLTSKTRKAIIELSGDIKTVILGGGVAANQFLIKEMKEMVREFPEITLSTPEKMLATDNAIMIGLAAFVEITKNPKLLEDKRELKAQGNLSFTY